MSSSGAVRTTLPSLTLSGLFSVPTVAKAGNYQLVAADFAVMVTTGAGAVAITLPAAPAAGRLVAVKKVDAGAGAVTVTPAAGTIDGAANCVLGTQGHGVLLHFDGANWWALAAITAAIA